MYGPEDLSSLLPNADFVLIATPLTGETRQLIGRAEFDLMKAGAGFINIGRAAVVDYTALSEKLQTGEISGAVLDVFDPEPLVELASMGRPQPYYYAARIIRRRCTIRCADPKSSSSQCATSGGASATAQSCPARTTILNMHFISKRAISSR